MPSKSPWVIGFDLSLTAPAGVALPLNWRPGDWRRVKVWLDHPKAPKSDDQPGRLCRYRLIADSARRFIESVMGVRGAPGPRLAGCYIEQYGFSKNNAQASKLMELGGIVRLDLFEKMGIVAETVGTSPSRKLLLGKVPKSDPKIAVQLCLFKAGAPKRWEENICDAMCVVNWGLSECGGIALAVG